MMPRPPPLSRFFNYHGLIALCVIGLVYHILFVQNGFTIRAPGPPRPPQQSTNEIPKLLWYKLGPKGLTEESREWTNTCIQNNPEYKATFMTEESGGKRDWKVFVRREM